MRLHGAFAKVLSAATFCGVLAVAAPAAQAGVVTDGADYLLLFQDNSVNGGFFADADHVDHFFPTNQGRIGSAILAGYFASSDPTYLTSAVKLGNAIINADAHVSPLTLATPTIRSELYFNSGASEPIVPTQTTYFLAQLSQVTGDPTYANYLKANLWDKLTVGSYASNSSDPGYTTAGFGAGGVNTAGFVSHFQSVVGSDFLPWMLAKPAVAANIAGETAIRDGLFVGILNGLENAAGGYGSYDVYALAAAVWASAVTGVNLDPTSGPWAAANSTADLAAILAAFAQLDGGFLPDSCGNADPLDPCFETSDAETTGLAVLALHLVDATLYASLVDAGLSYLAALQLPNGYVPTFSDTDGAHADIISEYLFAAASEPVTLAMFALGLGGIAAARRRRRS